MIGASDGLGSSVVIVSDTSDSENAADETSCDSQVVVQPPSVSPRVTRKNSIPLPFQVNPMSILKNSDLSRIRKSYSIPASVKLRIPEENERANSPCPNEIVVYEAYFALGLRETIPSLITQVAKFLSISPSQLTPSAWRMLIAIQVFGELHSEELGVKEVLYAHYFRAHDVDASAKMSQFDGLDGDGAIERFRIAAAEIASSSVTAKETTLRAASLKRSSATNEVAGVPPKPSKRAATGGEPLISQPANGAAAPSRHACIADQLNENASGAKMSRFDGLDGDGAFERFCIAAANLASSSVTHEPTLASGKETTSRTASLTRSSATNEVAGVPPKPSKRAATGGDPLISQPANEAAAPSRHASIADQLNENAFGQDVEGFEKLGTSVIFPQAQAELIKAASLCHFAETQLHLAQQGKVKDSEVITGLRQELASSREREKELRDNVIGIWTLKSEKDVLTARVASLVKELQQEQGRNKVDVEVAGCSATISTRWSLIRDYKLGNADKWDAKDAEKKYRDVMIASAKLYGKEPPVFPESFTNFESEDPSSAIEAKPVFLSL